MLGLASKLVTGFINLTMLMFSSYQGNNVSFSDVFVYSDHQAIILRTELISAFDNDFEAIFRSGKPIIIYFDLQVREEKVSTETHSFAHIVLYHPLRSHYQISVGASENQIIVESYKEMIDLITSVTFHYNHFGKSDLYHFTLTSYLGKIRLDTMDREFDLMMLWNFKQPSISFSYKVEEHED